MNTVFFSFNLFIVCVGLFCDALYLGDVCKAPGNVQGKCVYFMDCPEAIQGIRKGIFPETCGYEDTVPIVCCAAPSNGGGTDSTEETTTKRTTTKATTTEATTTTTTTRRTPTTSTTTEGVIQRLPNTVGSRSRQNCKAFSDKLKVKVKPPTLSLGGPLITRDDCGFVAKALIVGGDNVTRQEFPHMALLGYQEPNNPKIFWDCAGSLISEQYILTAAHCIYSRVHETEVSYASMGFVYINDKEYRQEYKIEKITSYPDHNPPSSYNDIALIKLEKPVKINAYVRPACLSIDKDVAYEKALASGWGHTEYNNEEGSEYMLKVALKIVDTESCGKYYRYPSDKRAVRDGIKKDIQICAGGAGKDTCQGDSGGPLQIYTIGIRCMYDIVGITSFGKSCGIGSSPGVYTKVANYIEWIEDIVWP